MQTTTGTLLGGRVRYDQPADGWRTGIEPVLLAASIPARPGDRVLEAGTGAGAGLLCLMTRVPGLVGMAVELDPDMAALAARNLAANGLDAVILAGDVAAAAGLGPVDHAFANPPWHDPAGTAPAGIRRVLAKQRDAAGLEHWVGALSACLAPQGTLTFVLPASMLAECLSLMLAAGLGAATVCPLWPRPSRPAKLVLLHARRAPAQTRILPGLTLHGAGSGYTPEADAILRDGAALPLTPSR